MRIQENANSKLIRLNSERSRTNSSLANRILPNELLQPAPTFEKEFNDLKMVNDFKLVGSQVGAQGGSSQQNPQLRKERGHAKSFNQKRMAFFKEGYTYFPIKDQSSHAVTEMVENSNTKQGSVVVPLYSWDEINHRSTPALTKQ